MINPHADVSIVSQKVSLIADPFSGMPFLDALKQESFNLLMQQASDVDSHIELSSYFGDKIKFGTTFVDNPASKYPVINLPRPYFNEMPAEFAVKVEVTLKRNDDPNADLIEAVYTYKPSLERVVDDGMPWLHHQTLPLVINSDQVYSGNYLAVGDTRIDGANVTFASGSNIYIAPGKEIRVVNGGTLTARGTRFQPSESGQRFDRIQFNTSGNMIENSTITGGTYNLVVYGHNNTVVNSTISNGKYGIWITNKDGLVVKGTKIFGHEHDGIRAWNSDINVRGNWYQNGTTLNVIPSNINNNNRYGITIGGYSQIYSHGTDYSGNSTSSVYIRQDSRYIMGGGGGTYGVGFTNPAPYEFANCGYNHISGSGYYIYNLAGTTDGENFISWTVPAQKNYWGSNAPSSSRFHGPVDYSNRLSKDYTQDQNGYFPKPRPFQHPSAESRETKIDPLLTSSMIADATEDQLQKGNRENAQRIADIRHELNELRKIIGKQANDPYDARRILQESYLILELEELGHRGSSQAHVNRRNQWAQAMAASRAASRVGQQPNLRRAGEPAAPAGRSAVATIKGEAALMSEINYLVRSDRYEEVIEQVEAYFPLIANLDNRANLYSALSVAHTHLGNYGLAYQALEQIEAIAPEPDMAANYIAPDFTLEKEHLAVQAAAAGQSLEGGQLERLAKKGTNGPDEASDLPTEFALNPSYPNPFNPTTQVPFSLPEAAHVKIEIYNLTGRLVSVLANEQFQAGNHTLAFNAESLSSGIYLVRAQLGNKVMTQKVTLVK